MTHNPNLDPDYSSLDEALSRARELADEMGAAQTVVAEIAHHRLCFYVLLTASYAELREKKLSDRMAPIASVLPNGGMDIYSGITEVKCVRGARSIR